LAKSGALGAEFLNEWLSDLQAVLCAEERMLCHQYLNGGEPLTLVAAFSTLQVGAEAALGEIGRGRIRDFLPR
jgi:hypothetical protein